VGAVTIDLEKLVSSRPFYNDCYAHIFTRISVQKYFLMVEYQYAFVGLFLFALQQI
jgi:hypothetical protein